MKKHVLALALLGAFAGVASAQANVTIYGVADIGLAFEKGGPNGSQTKVDGSGLHSGNRLGFRGTEDLGGGLKASFAFESGLDLATGAATQGGRAFGRQSWLALDGAFGTLKLGRQYTPIFLAIDSLDPVEGISGGAGNLMRRGGVRMNNTISYATPNMSGFTALAAYGFGGVAGNSSANRAIGLAVGYQTGPIAVKLAHHDARNAAGTDSEKNTYLGGSYNFGVAKGFLGYEVSKGVGTRDERDALLGVAVPFGPSTVMASYIRKDDKSAANADASLYELAYTYALSKRTNIYTSYLHINNRNGAAYTTKGGDGSGNKEFNIGLRHKF